MMNGHSGLRALLAASAAGALLAGAAFSQSQVDQAIDIAQESTEEGAAAQAQIDDIALEAADLERQYLALQEQIESQVVFVEQQRVFLRSQENEIEELNRQLERVETIERDFTPLILNMFVALEEFIAQDLEFQMALRQGRLDNIRRNLGDAQISAAERYRVILNAFEIEASYGRSLRSYREPVEREDGAPVEATLLQIGRVALIRRFPNGDTEIRTKDNPDWRPLPDGFANDVDRAVRIAEEVTTPQVFTAPLPAPQPARNQ